VPVTTDSSVTIVVLLTLDQTKTYPQNCVLQKHACMAAVTRISIDSCSANSLKQFTLHLCQCLLLSVEYTAIFPNYCKFRVLQLIHTLQNFVTCMCTGQNIVLHQYRQDRYKLPWSELKICQSWAAYAHSLQIARVV